MTSPFAHNLSERISAIQRAIETLTFRVSGGFVEGSTRDRSVRVLLRDGDAATVEIDRALVDPSETSRLETLLAEAIDDAGRRVDELRAARIESAIRAMIDELFADHRGNDAQ